MAKRSFEVCILPRDSPDVDERPWQRLRRLSEGDVRERGLPPRPSTPKHLLLVQRTMCVYRAILNLLEMLDEVSCFDPALIQGFNLLSNGAANQASDAAPREGNRDGQPLQAGNEDERLVQASR
ncbi:hypothetical protein CRG98_017900 [Punica granatum]|uniref:Uncharacterized protein n=1 Tax=Punica granatum TaxID=22663 RepID=A0A2I0K1U3_PUNGR|nr:hypothetical protein CRG98_017900 [Punica granatum]